MSLDLLPVFQAAVEYGATNSGAASGIAGLARNVTDRAGDAWDVVAANPVLLGGLVVVAILAILVLRSPAH